MPPSSNCETNIHNLTVRLSVLGEVLQHFLLPAHCFFSLLFYFSFSIPHSLYNSLPPIPSSLQVLYLLALSIKGKYHFVWFCPTKGHDGHDSFPEWKFRFNAPGALKKALLFPSHFEGNKEWCWCVDTHTLPNCSTAKTSHTPASFPSLVQLPAPAGTDAQSPSHSSGYCLGALSTVGKSMIFPTVAFIPTWKWNSR